MRILLSVLLPLIFASCSEQPGVSTATDGASERANSATYVKVNCQVRKNLVGRKIVEGDVLNTGRFQTYNSVTLRIEMIEDGRKSAAEYTVAGKLPPGGRNSFRYKPEGAPEHIDVRVSAATAD